MDTELFCLAKEQCLNYFKPLLLRDLPVLDHRVAFALVGEGSECFGYDDVVSKDHDYGLSYYVFLTKQDYNKYKDVVDRIYAQAMESFLNEPRLKHKWKMKNLYAAGIKRAGAFSIEDFYASVFGAEATSVAESDKALELNSILDTDKALDLKKLLTTDLAWLSLEEWRLATLSNGEVFEDELGIFSAYRKILLNYYPEDIRLKKLATVLAWAGQTGQYNLIRLHKRQDVVGGKLCLMQYIHHIIHAYHLIRKKYLPFYKWEYVSFKSLGLDENVYSLMERLCQETDKKNLETMVENLATGLIEELKKLGLLAGSNRQDFLFYLSQDIQRQIVDEKLRSTNILE